MIVFTVNGLPRSGKTTFEELVKEEGEKLDFVVHKDSIINPIKDIAMQHTTWSEEKKGPKDRKFLSDLKDAFDEYCDYTRQEIMSVATFLKQKEEESKEKFILFIDSREVDDIEFFNRELGAWRLFIERKELENELQSNHADANVYNAHYDIFIYNNTDLEDLREAAKAFLELIKEIT